MALALDMRFADNLLTKNIRNAIKSIDVKDVEGESTFFMKLLGTVFPNQRVCDGGRQMGVVDLGISLQSFGLNGFRFCHGTEVFMAVYVNSK